jgi:hypothetical protein
MFGHGQNECSNENQKKELESHMNDKINYNKRCKILDCTRKDTHSTEGHCCRYCGKRDEHMKQCPNNPNNSTSILTDPTSIANDPREHAKKLNIPNGYYTLFYAGMGCSWYVRNNNGNLEYYFMHSDSWGQYGDDTSDIPILNAFLENYKSFINE